jgi:hypothetical protein
VRVYNDNGMPVYDVLPNAVLKEFGFPCAGRSDAHAVLGTGPA